MKTTHLLLIAALLLLCPSIFAQKRELPLLLKTGSLKTASDLTPARLDSFNKHVARLQNKTVAVIQFENLPSRETRNELAANGLTLLDYIPQNAYTVSITGNLNQGSLQKAGVRMITTLAPKQKMHPALASGEVPGQGKKQGGMLDVQIAFPKTFTAAEVERALKAQKVQLLTSPLVRYGVLSIRVSATRLEELAALPFVLYVQPVPPPDKPLNFNSRISGRSALLNTAVADGGRGLNGEGVVIGVGDDDDVQFHADFSGRLINRTTNPVTDGHGTHTTGIAAGGGIVNELYRGAASKATIVSQDFAGIVFEAPAYVQDYDMVITSNSYEMGLQNRCAYTGVYDVYSYILDRQAFDLPSLQHVFSAGNSGAVSCSPYSAGYHTILGAYQTAKNVLTVANANYLGAIYSTSSKGPVNDGRLKPEITAMGTSVVSSSPTNGYASRTGTSMSGPAVGGGLALLYQRYRQLNNNQDPKSGLMKALLCNGATDKGNPGPDYTYGFGFMNLERSVLMLENNRYITGSILNSSTNAHTITVPANTAQLKVMLYWNDPAPAFVSSQALVNDLDITVTNPASVTTFPKILNPSPATVTATAVEGPDHINNIEQVVIDNPVAGTYTINIQGIVAQNPLQEYYVVYDFVPKDTWLVYPTGGATFAPSQQVNVAWESYGNTSNTYALEYSINNGTTWTAVSSTSSNIAATTRYFTWTVPALPSNQALVRIKQNNTAIVSTSAPFTILGVPTVSLAATQCEGYFNINWTAVTGATDYEVLLLRGSEMVPVATTTATTYSVSGLSKDSTYWVGVRARIGGKPGRRSVSISRKPNNGTCTGTISDNDLKVNAIVAPVSGRKGTISELHTAAIQVEIKNLDDAAVSAYTVGYRINNRAWVFENVATPLAAGSLSTYTFSTPEDFSAPGTYTITTVVKNNLPDAVVANDTLTRVIKQLENPPVSLATAFLDNVEGASEGTYTSTSVGIENADRYDFTPGTYGRLRTFINSGVALSGTKALAVDIDRTLSAAPLPVQHLTGTYNLSAYTAGVNDVRLQFKSINGCDVSDVQNRVAIRGNDAQPWIDVYIPGTGTSSSIEVGNWLASRGQNFSSSFQVRWSVPSSGQIVSQSASQGFLLDDVQLYEAFNDVQLLSIDNPIAMNCGLSNAVPLKITLRNSSNTSLTNVPVRYQINDGTWVVENVASIPAHAVIQYTFATGLNLAAAGIYELAAEVMCNGDTYSDNNLQRTTVYNSAIVSTFPYLQNFENGAGGWYAGGMNASWQFGTPGSAVINGAASGTNAWKTMLNGNYNDNELSYLYSPCFSVAGMTKPTISFSVALDLENCGTSFCDGAWLQYSTDNVNWYDLADLNGTGTNWYGAPFYAWTSENYTTWHVATMDLPTGFNTIRFRFVLQSDGAVNREGIAIDDIHIYDNNKGIYTGPTLTAPVTQTVSGSSWIDFESGGKLLASILPNNQNLGTTAVQAYINTGTVRFKGNQFYHDRNITIKPATRTPAAPATIRLYFLDTETNNLINASGCSGCTKPRSAYELGVSKYSVANQTYENGTLSDDLYSGRWSFIPAANAIKVPFDKGYYIEFSVPDFSEFWLSNGGIDNNTPLPVQLLQFTARRAGANAVLRWTTADEKSMSRYEIEVARTTDDWRNARFKTLGVVESQGDTTAQRQYLFEDTEPLKNGARYYRIKMIDLDGTYRYSDVRSVLFNETANWKVYPNPAHGLFYFVYQAAATDDVVIQVQDATGRIIKKQSLHSTGFLQKTIVDLTGQPAGVYLLQVYLNGVFQSTKLFKQ